MKPSQLFLLRQLTATTPSQLFLLRQSTATTPSHLFLLRQLTATTPSQCLRCQLRFFRTATALRSSPTRPKPNATSSTPNPFPVSSDTQTTTAPPQPYTPLISNHDPQFVPKTLGRPIGWPRPPHPSDNLDIDTRTRDQKREDFRNYDKHLERRQQMFKKIARPYFRDFTNMKYSKGKMWIANPRLWKKDMSLWFPNFWGRDLHGERANTVGLLEGRVGVVAIYSRTWAQWQVGTFVDDEVKSIIRNSGGRSQLLELNVEEGRLFRGVLWAFRGSIRKKRKETWQRYLVLSGIKDDAREILGLLNHKAGYVYLVDEEGKIRWAGCGDALPAEKEALAGGLRRLIEERRTVVNNVHSIPRVEKAAGAAGSVL